MFYLTITRDEKTKNFTYSRASLCLDNYIKAVEHYETTPEKVTISMNWHDPKEDAIKLIISKEVANA